MLRVYQDVCAEFRKHGDRNGSNWVTNNYYNSNSGKHRNIYERVVECSKSIKVCPNQKNRPQAVKQNQTYSMYDIPPIDISACDGPATRISKSHCITSQKHTRLQTKLQNLPPRVGVKSSSDLSTTMQWASSACEHSGITKDYVKRVMRSTRGTHATSGAHRRDFREPGLLPPSENSRSPCCHVDVVKPSGV